MFSRVKLVEPLGYLDFVNCMANAALVVTDSGGIQEETTILKVPCLTLRKNTERPATIDFGTNQLVPLETPVIIETAQKTLGAPVADRTPELWDGQASVRIAEHLLSHFSS